MAETDEMRARARDFLRDVHLELPRSAERRLMFALETFRAAAYAEGVRESARHLEKLAADLLEREEQREAAPNYETRSQARYFRFAAAAIRGQP